MYMLFFALFVVFVMNEKFKLVRLRPRIVLSRVEFEFFTCQNY